MVAALGVQAIHDGSRALPVPRRRDCPSHAGAGVAAADMTIDLDGGWVSLRTVAVPLGLAGTSAPGQIRRHGDPPASVTDPPAVRNPRRFTSQFPPKPVAPRRSLPAGISEPVPTSKKASIWLAMPSWPPTIAAWPGPAAPRHLADGLGQHRLFGRVLSQRLRLYLLRHVVQCRCHQATGGTVIEIDPGLANVPRPHPRAGTDDRPDRRPCCGP